MYYLPRCVAVIRGSSYGFMITSFRNRSWGFKRMNLKGLIFDLWDTLIVDHSDEPKRTVAGMPPKRQDRILKVLEVARRHRPLEVDEVAATCDEIHAQAQTAWSQEAKTIKVLDRVTEIFGRLSISPSQSELEEVTCYWEEMEYRFLPDAVPYVGEALASLSQRYRLALISDTGVTPGRVLRQILKHYGWIHFFDELLFSDEFGIAKPSPEVFHHILTKIQMRPQEVAHIGDRPEKDIDGAKRAGLTAILFTGVVKREPLAYRPDAVFGDYRRLESVLSELGTDPA